MNENPFELILTNPEGFSVSDVDLVLQIDLLIRFLDQEVKLDKEVDFRPKITI